MAASSSSSSSSGSFLDVKVGEPHLQGEGRSQHTTYRIETSQRGVDRFDQESYTVVRRYSDFDWLRKQLVILAPTAAVPPLPPKDALPMKNFKEEFIESRNRGLQRFVDRVAAHPRLRASEPTFQFLTLSDTDFSAAKEASKPKMAESMQAGALSLLGAAGSAIGAAVSRVRGQQGGGTKTPADISFEELEAYINGVHTALVAAEQACGAMITKRKDAAIRMMEYGHAYETLGKHEKDDLGASLAQVGATMKRQAQMEAMQAAGELRWFREDLRDAILVARTAQQAFAYRNSVSAKLQASKNAVEQRRMELERVRGDPGKQPAAEAASKAANEAMAEARKEFVQANNELLDEVAHLRSLRLADSKQVMLDYAVMEAMRGEAAQNLWGKLVEGANKAAEAEAAKLAAWREAGGDTRVAAAAVRADSDAASSSSSSSASSASASSA